ncbi:MAG: VWA domain-containing protein [Saprospiraceae bacterium]|nr:VWA domain-containing protein [Saprospiraceae bacterium]
MKASLLFRATMLLLILLVFFTACNQNGASYRYHDASTTTAAPATEYLMEKSQVPPPPSASENYKDYGENPFTNTLEQPVSTFAIDADGASYANVRRFLQHGQMPPTAAVRIEEMVNYFPYDYPAPKDGRPIALNGEISDCPWAKGHKLLRLGVKGQQIAKEDLPACNFVFLVDVSGSMDDPDKLELLKESFLLFTETLRPQDKIAIVTYAGEAGVALESTSGKEVSKIRKAIKGLSTGGSTNGEGGIHLAYQIAQQNFLPKGNNRVLLATDGDFNVGVSSEEELVKLIEEKRKSGVFLTVLGVGTGNLQDAQMEQLANNGNGTYEYIDNIQQAEKVFVQEFGKFFTVAKDVKIQLRFNPKLVQSYRLVGYENRLLDREEFYDDQKDAGEIGADQTITALYEIQPVSNARSWVEVAKSLTWLTGAEPDQPMNADDALRINCRYKLPNAQESSAFSLDLLAQSTDFEDASENMRFATSVAAAGLLLKESQNKGDLTWKQVVAWTEDAMDFDPGQWRKEFLEVAKEAKSQREPGLFSERR